MEKLRILSPIHRATRQIHLHLEREVCAHGLATVEGHLLTYLLSYEPSPIAELLRVFGLKRSTMTSMLDRLETAGLVLRKVSAQDRRSWLVTLTSTGRDKALIVREIVDRFENEVIGRLDAQAMLGFQQVIEAIGDVTSVQVRGKLE